LFVTSPVFEFKMPLGLAQPGQRFWRSVACSLNVPWLIVSVAYRDENEDESFCQDMLMASDDDLAELLDSDARDSVVGVQYVEPPNFSETQNWRMRNVTKIWRAAKTFESRLPALVFEDKSGRFVGPLSDAQVDRVVDLLCELPRP
jgi:hypothetical protein